MNTPSFFVYVTLIAIIANACNEDDKQVVHVEKGKFHATITETGELQAVNSKMITVPFYHWRYGKAKLIWLEKEGLQVQKGDVIARLDTSIIMGVKEEKEADLDIVQTDLEKLKVEHVSQIKKLLSDLKSAEAAFKLAEIDTERVRYESKARQEINQLKLKIAEFELQKVQNKIKHIQIIQNEELLIQEEKIKQIKSAIRIAERTINKFTIRAPGDGIVEYYRHKRSGEKIHVGQEFWPLRSLISLSDLSQMKVQTTINETDIVKIYIGQKVFVRLDAYPKIAFKGKINSISITCHEKEEKSKIKVFDVAVLLNERDPILKPGMTVSCEILVERT